MQRFVCISHWLLGLVYTVFQMSVGQERENWKCLTVAFQIAYLSSEVIQHATEVKIPTSVTFCSKPRKWSNGNEGIWIYVEVQQGQVKGPAPGEEQPHVPVQAWGGHTGEQLSGEGSGCPGGWQVNHEPAVCPGCQEGQWDPGVQ